MLSTPLGSGMALAKIILSKQQKVGEHYAQRCIVFGNAGSSLKSYRGVRLSSGRQLLGETGGVRKIPHALDAAIQRQLGAVRTGIEFFL
jgi:hypothetical protein